MHVNNAFRIVIDESRVVFKILVSLTDDSRGIIYDHNMFIAQTTADGTFKAFYSGTQELGPNVKKNLRP
jgi:hypothetical protein